MIPKLLLAAGLVAAAMAGICGSAAANALAPRVNPPRITIPTPVQALRTIDLGVKTNLEVRTRCTDDQKQKANALRDRHCQFD